GLEQGMKQGIERGIEQGMKEGKIQGINERNIEIAKSMLSKNFDLKIISEITKLPISDITKLNES
ncbi:MAG: hypothetical protein NC181_02490, partial [Clostridium sp.]|nr:hypothetical protein [Clostridium sp.]